MGVKTILLLCFSFVIYTLFCLGNNMTDEKKTKIFMMSDKPETRITVKTLGGFLI